MLRARATHCRTCSTVKMEVNNWTAVFLHVIQESTCPTAGRRKKTHNFSTNSTHHFHINQKQWVIQTHKCTDCLWCYGSPSLPCQGHGSMQACCWIRSHPAACQGGKQTILQCSSRGYNVLFCMSWQLHREPLARSCSIGPSNAFGTAAGVRTSPDYSSLNEQKEYSHTYLPSI